jgi:hypothetical protein
VHNAATFDTPGVYGGIQLSNEKNIFDFSLCEKVPKSDFQSQFSMPKII